MNPRWHHWHHSRGKSLLLLLEHCLSSSFGTTFLFRIVGGGGIFQRTLGIVNLFIFLLEFVYSSVKKANKMRITLS